MTTMSDDVDNIDDDNNYYNNDDQGYDYDNDNDDVLGEANSYTE
jgi:hypothetical protein